jgi:hypothetical protein
MVPGSLAKVRTVLAKLELSLDEKETLVESVLSCASTAEVKEVLQSC